MSARSRIYLSEEDFEMVDRAAYWEGFRSPAAFVSAVMRRYIEQRQVDRGAHYGKSKWSRNRTPLEDSDEDEP